MPPTYEDLYDIEKRPGAGVELWTAAVRRQLERVREVNHRHRLHRSPRPAEQRDDPGAADQLHADVYFLALAIRRVVLFHDALAAQVGDPRLTDARNRFDRAAPDAKVLRDVFEHLDEYLVDSERKRVDIEGRAAPVLHSRWDADNVVVVFGPLEVDVTLAAVAAIDLGETSAEIWDDHLERVKGDSSMDAPPDDGIPRMFELTVGRSTVIGSADDPPEIMTGVLLGTSIREATPEEIDDAADEEPDARA